MGTLMPNQTERDVLIDHLSAAEKSLHLSESWLADLLKEAIAALSESQPPAPSDELAHAERTAGEQITENFYLAQRLREVRDWSYRVAPVPTAAEMEGLKRILNGRDVALPDGVQPSAPAPSDDEAPTLEELGDRFEEELELGGDSSTLVPVVVAWLAEAGYRKAPTVDADLRERLVAAELAHHTFTAGDGFPSIAMHSNEEAADRALALVASSSPVDLHAELQEQLASIRAGSVNASREELVRRITAVGAVEWKSGDWLSDRLHAEYERGKAESSPVDRAARTTVRTMRETLSDHARALATVRPTEEDGQ